MEEKIYKRIENESIGSIAYKFLMIASSAGLIGGFALKLAGLITKNHDLYQAADYIINPTLCTLSGAICAETQYKRVSGLEKKVE